jgi:hypothetical protein
MARSGPEIIQVYLPPLRAYAPIHNYYMKEQQTSSFTYLTHMYTHLNTIILLPTACFNVKHNQIVTAVESRHTMFAGTRKILRITRSSIWV